MTIKHRIAALALALGMTVSLAACSTGSGDPSPSPSPSQEIEVDLNQDIMTFSAGIAPETPVLTINGTTVTADLYLYLLATNCMLAQYNYGLDLTTYGEQLKSDSATVAAYYLLREAKCQELGCPLTDEQQIQLQETLMANGQEVYDQYKTINGLTDPTVELIYSQNSYYQNLMNALVNPEPTEEELNNYVYQTRHILLLTVDTEGTPVLQEDGTYAYPSLGEDVVAEKLTLAQDILAQLRASDDPSTLFDELMNEYSEDSGLAANPDGYLSTPGEMVSAYEQASFALGFGEISDIVESEYGYHIIIRDPVDDLASYADQWKEYQLSTLTQQWVDAADIQTLEVLDGLNVADFYARYSAYQTELSAIYEAQAAEDAEASQSPDPAPTESVEAVG